MDFAISKQQRELQERAAEAVARVVEPIARAVPEGGKLGHTEMSALYRGLAPLGYLGSTIPEAEGGAAVLDSRSDVVPGTLYHEEIGYGDQRLIPPLAQRVAHQQHHHRLGLAPAVPEHIADDLESQFAARLREDDRLEFSGIGHDVLDQAHGGDAVDRPDQQAVDQRVADLGERSGERVRRDHVDRLGERPDHHLLRQPGHWRAAQHRRVR